MTWLPRAAGVPLDINHGIRDGRKGSVPFTHSLHAWNAVMSESKDNILPTAEIELFYKTQKLPAHPAFVAPEPDPLYGKRRPVFRRTEGNTRLTIFAGGHEIIHPAALNWLAAQRRGKPAVWELREIAELRTDEKEAESGK